MKIKDLLSIGGRQVITIGPNDTVHEAIQKLVENNIGALPVCEAKGTLVGIISERDILRVPKKYFPFPVSPFLKGKLREIQAQKSP
jgi:CBS domain-containing protein